MSIITIQIDTDKQVVVPIEPSEEMLQAEPVAMVDHCCEGGINWHNGNDIKIKCGTELYTTPQPDRTVKQPHLNHNWCVGCSPDNCSGCGAGSVAWMNTNGAFNDIKKVEQDALHAEAMSKLTEMIRTAQKPQLDRTAELEAALKVVSALLHEYKMGNTYKNKFVQEAIDKVNEVMKP